MGHIGSEVVLEEPAFIHSSAWLYGKITIGKDASVWPQVVMRSELYEIRIGARSNVQDFVMIHVGYDTPTIIGEDCSITHHATLHGCSIGNRCLIGINATIMDGAVIGDNSIVAGHAIVSEGKTFPANAVIAGVPAKQIAERDNAQENINNAAFYVQNGHNYSQHIERYDEQEFKLLMQRK